MQATKQEIRDFVSSAIRDGGSPEEALRYMTTNGALRKAIDELRPIELAPGLRAEWRKVEFDGVLVGAYAVCRMARNYNWLTPPEIRSYIEKNSEPLAFSALWVADRLFAVAVAETRETAAAIAAMFEAGFKEGRK